ncbi:hypothetical protein BC831DRAFT_475011 [Entophlyctis helioformis]|nr:hypothetical protein BC831DRAFT_475011 [Entophlyctis helioformis]
METLLAACVEEVTLEGEDGCKESHLWTLLSTRQKAHDAAVGQPLQPRHTAAFPFNHDLFLFAGDTHPSDTAAGKDAAPSSPQPATTAATTTTAAATTTRGANDKVIDQQTRSFLWSHLMRVDDILVFNGPPTASGSKPIDRSVLCQLSLVEARERFGAGNIHLVATLHARRQAMQLSRAVLHISDNGMVLLNLILKARGEGISQFQISRILGKDPRSVFHLVNIRIPCVYEGQRSQLCIHIRFKAVSGPYQAHLKSMGNMGKINAGMKTADLVIDGSRDSSDLAKVLDTTLAKIKISTLLHGSPKQLMATEDIMQALYLDRSAKMTRKFFYRIISSLEAEGCVETVNVKDPSHTGVKGGMIRCIHLVKPYVKNNKAATRDNSELANHDNQVLGEGGLMIDLPLEAQIYRIVAQAGEKGVLMSTIRRSLGYFEPKTITKVVEALSSKDRNGNTTAPLTRIAENARKARRIRVFASRALSGENDTSSSLAILAAVAAAFSNSPPARSTLSASQTMDQVTEPLMPSDDAVAGIDTLDGHQHDGRDPHDAPMTVQDNATTLDADGLVGASAHRRTRQTPAAKQAVSIRDEEAAEADEGDGAGLDTSTDQANTPQSVDTICKTCRRSTRTPGVSGAVVVQCFVCHDCFHGNCRPKKVKTEPKGPWFCSPDCRASYSIGRGRKKLAGSAAATPSKSAKAAGALAVLANTPGTPATLGSPSTPARALAMAGTAQTPVSQGRVSKKIEDVGSATMTGYKRSTVNSNIRRQLVLDVLEDSRFFVVDTKVGDRLQDYAESKGLDHGSVGRMDKRTVLRVVESLAGDGLIRMHSISIQQINGGITVKVMAIHLSESLDSPIVANAIQSMHESTLLGPHFRPKIPERVEGVQVERLRRTAAAQLADASEPSVADHYTSLAEMEGTDGSELIGMDINYIQQDQAGTSASDAALAPTPAKGQASSTWRDIMIGYGFLDAKMLRARLLYEWIFGISVVSPAQHAPSAANAGAAGAASESGSLQTLAHPGDTGSRNVVRTNRCVDVFRLISELPFDLYLKCVGQKSASPAIDAFLHSRSDYATVKVLDLPIDIKASIFGHRYRRILNELLVNLCKLGLVHAATPLETTVIPPGSSMPVVVPQGSIDSAAEENWLAGGKMPSMLRVERIVKLYDYSVTPPLPTQNITMRTMADVRDYWVLLENRCLARATHLTRHRRSRKALETSGDGGNGGEDEDGSNGDNDEENIDADGDPAMDDLDNPRRSAKNFRQLRRRNLTSSTNNPSGEHPASVTLGSPASATNAETGTDEQGAVIELEETKPKERLPYAFLFHVRNWRFSAPYTEFQKSKLKSFVNRTTGATPQHNDVICRNLAKETSLSIPRVRYFFRKQEEAILGRLNVKKAKQHAQAMAKFRSLDIIAHRRRLQMARQAASASQDGLGHPAGAEAEAARLDTAIVTSHPKVLGLAPSPPFRSRSRQIWTKDEDEDLVHAYVVIADRQQHQRLTWVPISNLYEGEKQGDSARRRMQVLRRSAMFSERLRVLGRYWTKIFPRGLQEGRYDPQTEKRTVDLDIRGMVRYFRECMANEDLQHGPRGLATVHLPADHATLMSNFIFSDARSDVSREFLVPVDEGLEMCTSTRMRLSIMYARAITMDCNKHDEICDMPLSGDFNLFMERQLAGTDMGDRPAAQSLSSQPAPWLSAIIRNSPSQQSAMEWYIDHHKIRAVAKMTLLTPDAIYNASQAFLIYSMFSSDKISRALESLKDEQTITRTTAYPDHNRRVPGRQFWLSEKFLSGISGPLPFRMIPNAFTTWQKLRTELARLNRDASLAASESAAQPSSASLAVAKPTAVSLVMSGPFSDGAVVAVLLGMVAMGKLRVSPVSEQASRQEAAGAELVASAESVLPMNMALVKAGEAGDQRRFLPVRISLARDVNGQLKRPAAALEHSSMPNSVAHTHAANGPLPPSKRARRSSHVDNGPAAMASRQAISATSATPASNPVNGPQANQGQPSSANIAADDHDVLMAVDDEQVAEQAIDPYNVIRRAAAEHQVLHDRLVQLYSFISSGKALGKTPRQLMTLPDPDLGRNLDLLLSLSVAPNTMLVTRTGFTEHHYARESIMTVDPDLVSGQVRRRRRQATLPSDPATSGSAMESQASSTPQPLSFSGILRANLGHAHAADTRLAMESPKTFPARLWYGTEGSKLDGVFLACLESVLGIIVEKPGIYESRIHRAVSHVMTRVELREALEELVARGACRRDRYKLGRPLTSAFDGLFSPTTTSEHLLTPIDDKYFGSDCVSAYFPTMDWFTATSTPSPLRT